MSTDVVKRDEAALAEAGLSQIDANDLVLPMLQVTQQLSKAVTEGDAESGHFFNALTGEDHGSEIELVVVAYFKGRFYSNRDGQAFVATGDVAPDNWPAEYAGQPFVDLPDAEENFRERVNAGEIAWEGGPPIRTTYNYVGFLPLEPEVPVRLSLQRTSTPAARKINTLLRFSRAPWDAAIALETELRHDKQQRPFYVVKASRGRQTDSDERQAAVELAYHVQSAQLQFAGDEAAEAKAVPKAKDALDV